MLRTFRVGPRDIMIPSILDERSIMTTTIDQVGNTIAMTFHRQHTNDDENPPGLTWELSNATTSAQNGNTDLTHRRRVDSTWLPSNMVKELSHWSSIANLPS